MWSSFTWFRGSEGSDHGEGVRKTIKQEKLVEVLWLHLEDALKLIRSG